MTTKRVLGRLVMIALAAMTAGVMPASTCRNCRWRTDWSVPNTYTYDEQSSIGNAFELAWIWFETVVVLPIL